MESTDWNNPVIKLGDVFDLFLREDETALDQYAADEWLHDQQLEDWQ